MSSVDASTLRCPRLSDRNGSFAPRRRNPRFSSTGGQAGQRLGGRIPATERVTTRLATKRSEIEALVDSPFKRAGDCAGGGQRQFRRRNDAAVAAARQAECDRSNAGGRRRATVERRQISPAPASPATIRRTPRSRFRRRGFHGRSPRRRRRSVPPLALMQDRIEDSPIGLRPPTA